MTYELAKKDDLQTVYKVVQHTIKTTYPKYYPAAALYEKLGFSTIKHERYPVENGVILAYEVMEKELHKKVKTGKCHSVPNVMENGKIELSEQWEWASGDYSKGESLLVEV